VTTAAHAFAVLAGALAMDALVGEPPAPVHPVVWMGRLQRGLRRWAPARPGPAFFYGAGMAAAGPLLFGLGGAALIHALGSWPAAQIALEVYLLKSALAVRALAVAALAVRAALLQRDLTAARSALRSLVSRNTSTLPAPLLAAAAVESVAENASDSLVAPLLYYVLLGVPGALAYRAANTLDAQIGYHGETEWLGKPAARLDDALNLIPARLTAALLVAASALCHASPAGALRVWWTDGSATESPNAGRPMAAMAGALRVQLEKVGHYRLGAPAPEPGPEDISRSVLLLLVASALAGVACATLLTLHASHT
jgi:adenosylcobinamide-phosphate synthase